MAVSPAANVCLVRIELLSEGGLIAVPCLVQAFYGGQAADRVEDGPRQVGEAEIGLGKIRVGQISLQ